ncbi:uncharacterized protein M6B38_209495 [Iris pallida]|uniref:Uncharacterized protein n=1 Tax=Iris pallida TaxID=29817 RepID=A0AAX6E5B5_IRIPA|nr:uncharacterized protein M6B38_209495 [Iris pallida]
MRERERERREREERERDGVHVEGETIVLLRRSGVGVGGGVLFPAQGYELAHEALSQQVREGYESLEGRCEVLSARVTALEDLKKPETTAPVDPSRCNVVPR